MSSKYRLVPTVVGVRTKKKLETAARLRPRLGTWSSSNKVNGEARIARVRADALLPHAGERAPSCSRKRTFPLLYTLRIPYHVPVQGTWCAGNLRTPKTRRGIAITVRVSGSSYKSNTSQPDAPPGRHMGKPMMKKFCACPSRAAYSDGCTCCCRYPSSNSRALEPKPSHQAYS